MNELLDAEFYSRISASNAKWFITRRNAALYFDSRDDIAQFFSELQIPFPTRGSALFMSIVYFARYLVYPNLDIASEHLRVWADKTGASFHTGKKASTKPRINLGKQIYIMPIELYYTPTGIAKQAQPNVYEDEPIDLTAFNDLLPGN